MLGAVKMEGHEPSDWSSYYAEPEVSACLRPGKWGGRCLRVPSLRTLPSRAPVPPPPHL